MMTSPCTGGPTAAPHAHASAVASAIPSLPRRQRFIRFAFWLDPREMKSLNPVTYRTAHDYAAGRSAAQQAACLLDVVIFTNRDLRGAQAPGNRRGHRARHGGQLLE